MKPIEVWLYEYGESHRNKTNKIIHWFCIPLIMFSLIGVLWVIPVPEIFERALPYRLLNWGSISIVLMLFFYLRLSFSIFLGFVFVGALIVLGNLLLFQLGVWIHLAISLGIFILSWIAQFIGHDIEGKKPSFFKDLQFLLIGPAWLMHFIYKKIGLSY